MSGCSIRICALVLLMAVFMAFTDSAATVAALLDDVSADQCCGLEDRGTAEKNIPCDVPNCNCSLCSSAAVLTDLPAMETPLLPPRLHQVASWRFHLKEFPRLIDYPPEAA